MLTETGEPTEALDVLCLHWTGAYPENGSSSIVSLYMNNAALEPNSILSSGTKATFSVFLTDPNNDKMRCSWELYPESTELKSGRDAESKPTLILDHLQGNTHAKVKLNVPETEGKYRLFVTVRGGNTVAYANIPFFVKTDSDTPSTSN